MLHAPHARTTGTAEHANDRIDTSAASRASRARQVARSVAVPRGTRRLAFVVHQRGQARAGRGGAGRLSTGQQSLPRAVRVCAEARRADGESEAREPLDERGPGQPLGLLPHKEGGSDQRATTLLLPLCCVATRMLHCNVGGVSTEAAGGAARCNKLSTHGHRRTARCQLAPSKSAQWVIPRCSRGNQKPGRPTPRSGRARERMSASARAQRRRRTCPACKELETRGEETDDRTKGTDNRTEGYG